MCVGALPACSEPSIEMDKSTALPRIVQTLENHQGTSVPLLGDWTKGTKLFAESNADKDAKATFDSGTIIFLMTRGISTSPAGIFDMKLLNRIMDDSKCKKVLIPGTSDVVKNAEYQNASYVYAAKFNRRMAILAGFASEKDFK